MQVLSNKKRQRGGIGMNAEDELRKKIGKENPFKVPEGYFADFTSKMMDKLPEKMQVPENARVSTWTKLKPLLYMAAMFAGIWCMMYIFSDIKSASSKNLGFNPEIADAMNDEQFVNEFMMTGNISDYDLLMEMYNEGVDASVFDSDTIN